MKPIKKIAGDLLLFFYAQQRKRGFADDSVIEFGNANKYGVVMDDSKLSRDMLKISNGSRTDVYNALKYLEEKRFVSFREDKTNISSLIYNIRVTSNGIDVIEEIEKGKEGRKRFVVNFNIKLAENITVDSLIKNEVESLVKASLV